MYSTVSSFQHGGIVIIPWFGAVGKATYSVSGHSNETGFLLEITGRQSGVTKRFTTRNYRPQENQYGGSDPFLLGVLILIGFICNLIKIPRSPIHPYYADVLAGVVWFLLAINTSITLFLIDRRLRRKRTSEWHACEHKSAVLLESGLAPTTENLKKCPETLARCGTTKLIAYMGFPVGLWCFLYTISWVGAIPPQQGIFYTLLSLLLLWSSFTTLVTRRLQHQYPEGALLSLLITIPILPIALSVERIFTLKKPSEEKLRQTAEDLEKFMAESGMLAYLTESTKS